MTIRYRGQDGSGNVSPSSVFYPGVFDSNFTAVPFSLVGGLEVELVLILTFNAPALRRAGLIRRANQAQCRQEGLDREAGSAHAHKRADDLFRNSECWARLGIAIALTNWRARDGEELVNGKIALQDAYTADNGWPPAQLLGERVLDHRQDAGATLIVVLLLSLGIWAAIWGAVSSVLAALP